MTAPARLRYETLDTWRGVACLLVIVFHSTFGYVVTPESTARVLSEGGSVVEWLATTTSFFWVGVPLFFVISGYCIAASADATRHSSHPRPVRRFFARRFLRIYPPLWGFLVLAAVGVSCVPEWAMAGPHHGFDRPMPYPGEIPWESWFGAVTLTEEWRHHLGGPPRQYMAGHLWTLCYEEQFYLVAGLLLLAVPRYFFAGAAAVSVVVLVCFCNGWTVKGVFIDGQWLPFAAGVAAYYRANRETGLRRGYFDLLLIAGVLASLGYIPRMLGLSEWVPLSMATAFGFALLLGWLQPFDSTTARLRILTPLRWCGVRCYSLYLMHGPVVVLLKWNLYRLGVISELGTLLVTVPACILGSVLVAAPFHRWVEHRFLPGSADPRGGKDS